MNDLAEYIELIVEPTWEEYRKNSGSARLAYLTCVVAYHAVDRAAYPDEEPSELAEKWAAESKPFMLVAEVAMHLKHGTRRWVKKAKEQDPDALLITLPLGLQGGLAGLETRNLFFQIRDTIIFLRTKVAGAVE
jgi:hypothetical protein